MGKGDDESGGGVGVGGEDVYKGNAKPVLDSVSDSYLEDEIISICDSGPSSSPTYTITDYFYQLATALRRTFYSKQCFKNDCCSFA